MKEKRIGVYICWCGTNISMMVDVEAIAEYMSKQPDVIVSRDYKYMCSDPGQDLIIKDIKEKNLNRVVVAACSPRIHELTFRRALENAGLNPYMFQMANIREQNSWVHSNREDATAKAKKLILGAINRVKHHESLEKRTVEVNPATLVIGGGITGLSSALELANAGKNVFLIEKSDHLGGMAAKFDLAYPHMYSISKMIREKSEQVTKHPKVTLFLNSKLSDISGFVGNFKGMVQKEDGKETSIDFGNIIVATGLQSFDPSGIDNYAYGKIPDVVTSIEFEEMLKKGKIITQEGKIPNSIAIIHCVGSRNSNYHEYCSRTCCSVAVKFANQIRSAIPESNIYDIYADMRTFGKGCEELYTSTSRRDVMFLVFDQEKGLLKISKGSESQDGNIIIEMDELLSREKIEITTDMVILMVGVEAHMDAKETGHLVGISTCGNNFYIEKHPKLDPVATTTDGVYITGNCQGPKDITDSVAQARAATARILASIAHGSVQVETTTSKVNEEICCGCQTCIGVCPYTAIHFDSDKRVSVVNEVLCKGCGTCGSACPTGAVHIKHFTDQQILSQIEGLLQPVTI